MDKEKEIDEISDIIDDTVCIDYRHSRYDCLVGGKTAAKCIIEAGYRKADEVRKETAKEILQCLFDNNFAKVNDYEHRSVGYSVHDFYCEIKRLAEKYGVEVGE